MVNNEDNVKGMPIERNYEPHIQGGDMFLNKQYDDYANDNSYNIDDAIEGSKDNKENSRDTEVEFQFGSTGADDEYTAAIDMSVSKRKNYAYSLLAALIVTGILVLAYFYYC